MADPNNQGRAYSAAHFALELDGKEDVGLFRSIEGGSIKADVMTYQGGANYDRWRQLGKPKFEDIKLQVAASMSQPFYKWIENFTKGIPDRRDGAILAADFYYLERARREFKNAIIKEFTFPKLDATDKNPAYMSIALAVEEIVFLKGTGKKLSQVAGSNAWSQQKLWTSNKFRFSLDGLGEACKNVTKVDSFTIKQNVIEYHMGGRRAPIKTGSAIDFPQLSFYVPEPDAGPFLKRFKERGVDGVLRGSSDQKSGELLTYDNQGRNLFALQFFNADICNVQPDKADAATEEIKQMKIDLYCEKMTFEYIAMSVE
jgi:phage tail-like protein